ncbi:hypothetical protein B0H11DRAFT_2038172 [Mycena galericulata]|nr:hypothetical protein B0H11DRAFT_2038172 [Mycena galericulata]
MYSSRLSSLLRQTPRSGMQISSTSHIQRALNLTEVDAPGIARSSDGDTMEREGAERQHVSVVQQHPHRVHPCLHIFFRDTKMVENLADHGNLVEFCNGLRALGAAMLRERSLIGFDDGTRVRDCFAQALFREIGLIVEGTSHLLESPQPE